jgi:hypothetical protein
MATGAVVVYPGAMSDSTEFEPGVYVKGDKSRRVETRSDAVAAVYEGFKRDRALDSDEVEALEPDKVEDDGANGVGTLGTGDVSEGSDPGPATGSATYVV